MLRQQRRNRPLLAGAILLCLLIGLYLAASKRFSKSTSTGKVVKHSVETPAEDVLKYWTVDNMRKAKPAPMPHISAPDAGKRATRRPRSKKARGKREE